MSRINSLFSILILIAWLQPAGKTSAAESLARPNAHRPNLVILLADQWRAKATGYAGDPNVKTPNLDRLARESICFRNAVSVCPVCTPYRAALMTGRWPTSTGMFVNDLYLPASERCMGEVFQEAGYATAYIGKWHLDGHGRESYIPPERRHGWNYWKAAECDHNYNHSHYYSGRSAEKRFWPGYDAFAQTDDAQTYLRQQAKAGRPFVLMVSYGPPHFPHETAPQPYKDLYPPEKLRLASNVPRDMEGKVRREAQGYYAHCTALDKCVGEVMATLASAGLTDNTILVFTSDHGEMMGAHGGQPYLKQVAWDESAHVPLLLRWPAVLGRQGRTIQTSLTTPDILPTLLGLAGVAVPKSVEGEDLSGLIRNGREQPDRAALYMAVAPFGGGAFNREYRAIRTSHYTYVRRLNGPWLLFDDQRDPDQMNNLLGQPEFAATSRDLDHRLGAELKKIGDDFRPAKHYIEAWGYEVSREGVISYGPSAKVQSPRRNLPSPARGRGAGGEGGLPAKFQSHS
jgi:arylsulfatase A-like enzyme